MIHVFCTPPHPSPCVLPNEVRSGTGGAVCAASAGAEVRPSIPWPCVPQAAGERGPLRLLSKPVQLHGHDSPHCKEGTEGMSTPTIGIDVSKDWLDVATADGEDRFRVATDRAGLDALVERLSAPGGAPLVGLEASGGYERVVIDRLRQAGIAVRLVDPARVRQFARATGVKAKNDRLDAAVIAAFTDTVDGPEVSDDDHRRRLRAFVAHRRQLSDTIVALDNQMRLVTDPELRAMAAEHRALLVRQRKRRRTSHRRHPRPGPHHRGPLRALAHRARRRPRPRLDPDRRNARTGNPRPGEDRRPRRRRALRPR